MDNTLVSERGLMIRLLATYVIPGTQQRVQDQKRTYLTSYAAISTVVFLIWYVYVEKFVLHRRLHGVATCVSLYA